MNELMGDGNVKVFTIFWSKEAEIDRREWVLKTQSRLSISAYCRYLDCCLEK